MDESGMIAFGFDPDQLVAAANAADQISVVTVPTTQPDFNTSGSTSVFDVLGKVAAAASSVAGVVQQVRQLPNQYRFNAAIDAQNQQLGLQALQTQGKIATLANQTALVRAQAEFNKAAGIVTAAPLTTVLTVAGLVLAALALWHK